MFSLATQWLLCFYLLSCIFRVNFVQHMLWYQHSGVATRRPPFIVEAISRLVSSIVGTSTTRPCGMFCWLLREERRDKMIGFLVVGVVVQGKEEKRPAQEFFSFWVKQDLHWKACANRTLKKSMTIHQQTQSWK